MASDLLKFILSSDTFEKDQRDMMVKYFNPSDVQYYANFDHGNYLHLKERLVKFAHDDKHKELAVTFNKLYKRLRSMDLNEDDKQCFTMCMAKVIDQIMEHHHAFMAEGRVEYNYEI